MLEQAKRPASALKSASAPSADAALRRPIDREVDPFGPQLAVPENKRQTKKAGCSTCGGAPRSCSTCGAQEDLKSPPAVAKRTAEADRSDPAELQADAIGARIGAAIPEHAVSAGPLSPSARSTAEDHLGVDLAGTKLDGGSTGHSKAQSEGALAVTEGSDIAFANGQLQQNSEGRFLLGHELVHVAQQRAAQREVPQRLTKAGEDTKVPEGQGGMSLPEGASAEGKTPAKAKASRQPSGVTMRWGDLYLAADKDFLVDQLLGVIEQSGDPNAAERFVKGFEFDNSIYGPPASNPTPKEASGGAEGAPNQATPTKSTKGEHELAVTIAPFLRSALATVQAKMDVYLEQFSKRAIEILNGLLDKSRERVQQEKERYGLEREAGQSGRGGSEGAPGVEEEKEKIPGGQASMQASVRTAGLLGAAQELLAKDRHIKALQSKARELAPPSDRLWGTDPPNPRLAELGKEISVEKRKLRILHEGYQAKYPILGSFMKNGLGDIKTAELETLTSTKSTGAEVANVLLVEIESRLTNIEKTREAAGKTLSIWQLPKVVAITSSDKGTKKGSWEDAAVRTSVTDSEGGIADIALGVLGLVLGVAGAAFTGGASLVVSGVALGISVDQIAKDIQAYDLQSAAANTDFDKAQSISDSDPSLFWLALSVVGLALDLGEALRAFRALRGPVRSVMQASETGLKQAETDLRVAARANKAEGIAEGLIEKARKATNADNPKPAFEMGAALSRRTHFRVIPIT